jgi:hypothetical protein
MQLSDTAQAHSDAGSDPAWGGDGIIPLSYPPRVSDLPI